MSSALIRCLVADDHEIVREAAAGRLAAEDDIEVVGTAGDGPEAIALIERRRPDVALVDLRMPGLSGAEVCAELAERAVRTGVLLYTAEVDHETIRAGLEAGARGVVLKAGPGDDLPRAVRAVAGGATYIEPTLAGALVGGGRKLGVLTNRERQVLQLIANGITTDGVAHELGLSPNTVRSYVESATSKLGARGRSHAVAEAFRRQLIV